MGIARCFAAAGQACAAVRHAEHVKRQTPWVPVQARRVRDEAREEQQRLAAERRLTFKQKEKRKRELGQAKGGKGNYVEEEKRIARTFGVYSGFDS